MILETEGDLFVIRPEPLRRLLDLQYAGIVRSLERELRRRPAAGLRILDAGAGSAPYRELFVGASEFRTLDPYRPADYRDWDDLPGEAGFDVILLIEMLEHARDPHRVLRRAAAVLADGGELWISVPFAARTHGAPSDFWRWTAEGLEALAGACGLSLERLEPRGTAVTSLLSKAFLLGATEMTRRKSPVRRLAAVASLALFVPWALPLGHLTLRNAGRDERDPLGFFAIAIRQ